MQHQVNSINTIFYAWGSSHVPSRVEHCTGHGMPPLKILNNLKEIKEILLVLLGVVMF